MVGEHIFFYPSFVILVTVLAAQIFRWKRILNFARGIFFASVIGVFGYLAYIVYLQFQTFREGVFGFLGIGERVTWFLGYVQLHFLNQYVLSLLTALIIIGIAQYFHKRRGERFFEREELYIVTLGIFLVGYPGWLFYLGAMLIVPAIVSAIFVKRGERLSLYYFWMPTALITITWIQFFAQGQLWWLQFRF